MFSVGSNNARNGQRYRRLNRPHIERRGIKSKHLFLKKCNLSMQNNRITFNSILKTRLEKQENTNSLNNDALYMICSHLITPTDEGFYQNKFEHFISIQNNGFINQENNILYKKYINAFIETQKLYYALNKMAYMWKLKKYKIGSNTDMYMNELNEHDKNVICILQNNRKYLFTLFDLNRIVHKCLGEANDFYSTPIPCKNPFTNLPFTKCNLYNIYFAVKKSNIEISELFYYFYRTDFSLRHYIDKYETILRDYNIKNYCELNEDDKDDIYESIDEMIFHYNKKHKNNQIRIDSKFPKDVLISIFKPYLKYYYKSIYSLSNNTRHENALFVNSLLYNFTKKNPFFGRRKRVEHFIGHSYSYESSVCDFEAPINYKKNISNCHLKNANNYSNIVNNYIKNEDRICSNNENNENHTFQSLSNMLRNTVINNSLLATDSLSSSYPNVHIHFNEDGNINNSDVTTENVNETENMVGLEEEDMSETSSTITEVLDYQSNTSAIMGSYMEEGEEEEEEEQRETESVS
jgi:hypothetical protein